MTTILPAGTVFHIPLDIYISHPDAELNDISEKPYWQNILNMFIFHGIIFNYSDNSGTSINDLRTVDHDGNHPQTVYWHDDTPIFSITNTNGHYAFYPFTCQCHHHRHCGCDDDCAMDDECDCDCHGDFVCTCFSHCHTPFLV